MNVSTVLLNQPIVIDNGSGVLKAGFAGDEIPKCFFPSCVGRPKHARVMAGALSEDIYVGPKASAPELRGLLKIRYPMSNGVVQHWDDLERIWSYVYARGLTEPSITSNVDQNQQQQQQQQHQNSSENYAPDSSYLPPSSSGADSTNNITSSNRDLIPQIAPEDHPVLITEPVLNPASHRARMAEIFFESFNVPALYVGLQGVLALYASGRTTGTVLDVGDGVSHAIPIYNGFAINNAAQRFDLAGRDVTSYFATLLRKSQPLVDFSTSMRASTNTFSTSRSRIASRILSSSSAANSSVNPSMNPSSNPLNTDPAIAMSSTLSSTPIHSIGTAGGPMASSNRLFSSNIDHPKSYYGYLTFSTSAEMEIVRRIKESRTYIASDPRREEREYRQAFLSGMTSNSPSLPTTNISNSSSSNMNSNINTSTTGSSSTGAKSASSQGNNNDNGRTQDSMNKTIPNRSVSVGDNNKVKSLSKCIPETYVLPDGRLIKLGPERFRANEILFHPELIGYEYPGVQNLVYDSIMRADVDLRPHLYSNIVLAGGGTLTRGFGERLLNELRLLVPSDVKIKIFAPPERKYSTWIGGSILAGLSSFRKMWVSADEWNENPDLIHSKCM